jgi:hypothetical protein
MSLFERATKSLYTEKEDYFDLSDDRLMNFIDKIRARTISTGWDIFDITWTPDGATADVTKNILNNYGEIPLEAVAVHADALVTDNSRVTQEDQQLLECLQKSLTEAATNTINLYQNDFFVSGHFSGILLLKVITRESQVDTFATNNRLLIQLTSGLPALMASHGNNIKAFNEEVKHIIKRVTARGGQPGSLVPQLFDVFTSVEDGDGHFGRYLEHIQDDYCDGKLRLTNEQLMAKAQVKYEELVEKNKFKAGPKKEDAIMSLAAEVKSQMEAMEAKLDDIGKNGTPAKKKGGGNPRKKGKFKKEPWMLVAPKDGEPLDMERDGLDWHWCTGHGHHDPMWSRHTREKCRGLLKKQENEAKNEGSKTPKSESAKEEEARKNVSWATKASAMIAKMRVYDSDDE